jgi:hypothetical protein
MRGRRVFAVVGMAAAAAALGAAPAGPGAGAQVPTGDSVTGTGTVVFEFVGLPGSITTPFEFDVQSGPSGEDPTGQVSFSGLSISAPITCLEVRTLPTNPPVSQATMNIVTSQFGLVTLQVSDGNPEGLPDTISSLTSSPRSPTDCSPLPFGGENVRGTVVSGDVHIVDAPALPTSTEQCRDGGYVQYGFKNQGECIAFVVRAPTS